MLQIPVAPFPPSQHLPKEENRRGLMCVVTAVETQSSPGHDMSRILPLWGPALSRLGSGEIFSTLLHFSFPYHTTTAASVGYFNTKYCFYIVVLAEIFYFYSSSARFFDDCGEHWRPTSYHHQTLPLPVADFLFTSQIWFMIVLSMFGALLK